MDKLITKFYDTFWYSFLGAILFGMPSIFWSKINDIDHVAITYEVPNTLSFNCPAIVGLCSIICVILFAAAFISLIIGAFIALYASLKFDI